MHLFGLELGFSFSLFSFFLFYKGSIEGANLAKICACVYVWFYICTD